MHIDGNIPIEQMLEMRAGSKNDLATKRRLLAYPREFDTEVTMNCNGKPCFSGFRVGKNIVLEGITFENARGGLVTIPKGGKLVLKDCIIRNCSHANGGAITNEGSLELERVVFDANEAYHGNGGALYNSGESLGVKDCIFKNNMAKVMEGAIYLVNTNGATIQNTVFEGNLAHINGGAMFVDAAEILLTNCTLDRNKATEFKSLLTITQGPTRAPTRGPVTSLPTHAPTQSPTLAPSSSPTHSPTKGPTTRGALKLTFFNRFKISPTISTSSPTLNTTSPTIATSSPSTAIPLSSSPTYSPTSLAPTYTGQTYAPTNAPVSKVPSLAPSLAPISQSPTSSAPTASPTPPVPLELVAEAKLLTSKGGAVACTSSKVVVVNTIVSGNSGGLGGGFFVEFSSVLIQRSSLDGNSAFMRDGNGGLGGAIYSIGDSVPLTIVNLKLMNNEASGGGAVYLVFSKADMKWSACDNKTALTGGGCFLVSGGAASVVIADSTFYANEAQDGAGMLFVGSAASEVVNCDFIANHALCNGGGIKTEGVLKLSFINLAFQENIADDGGGGIFWDLSVPNLQGINASGTFNNSAGYGPVYASTAKHLVWTKQLTLDEVVASALPFDTTLTAEVRDYHMQTLATNSRSSVSIEFPDEEKVGKLKPTLISEAEALKNGVATFAGVLIRKKPDNPSSIYLEVNVDDKVIRSQTLDLYFRQCLAGEYEDVTNQLCTDCPKGTITTNDSLTTCTACAPGTIAARPGMSMCEACVPGTFAMFEGLAVCSPCSTTTFEPTFGSKECMACPGFSSSILPENYTDPVIDGNGMKCFCDRGLYALEQTISLKLQNVILSEAAKRNEPAGFTCETCVEGGSCAKRGTTRLLISSLPGFTPGRD
jgi:hypothetical protein